VSTVDVAPAAPPIGVLGGMGPLASAEFLKTIYEASLDRPEQQTPSVVLHSDPSMPDRTTAFLNGGTPLVLARFIRSLEALDAEGVSRIVVCCVTIHHLLPQLPPELRGRIVSLIDVIADAVTATPERHLLLCTTGTRQLRLFERHEAWDRMRQHLLLPDDEDQARVHETIYRVKQFGDVPLLVRTVEELLAKYDARSFVAACTEVHFAAKQINRAGASFRCIDPLQIIAADMARGRL